MATERLVKVPLSFLVDAWAVAMHITEDDEFWKCNNLIGKCFDIISVFDEKMDAIDRRIKFRDYKMAPLGSHERNILRKIYLDTAMVHKNCRSDKEVLDDPPF